MSARAARARQELTAADPVLGAVIERLGPLTLGRRDGSPFAAACRIVVGQQLSTKAASTIWGRFAALVGEVTPARLAHRDPTQLRQSGLSGAKAKAVVAIARAVDDGFDLAALGDLAADTARERLLTLRGFGPWSCDMFLMFTLGHDDVFSPGDAGLRRAMRGLYRIGPTAGPQRYERIAARWTPWRTLACRYLWASLDGVPG